MAIAADLASSLKTHRDIATAEVAGGGFVNIAITADSRCEPVSDALAAAANYGCCSSQSGRILLEFVSANPTGPLHVGHGRAAAIGDSLARILRFAGAEVTTEYYLNDRGRQIDVLGASLWLRVLEQGGTMSEPPPPGTYEGKYLVQVAKAFRAEPCFGDFPVSAISLAGLPTAPAAAAAEVSSRVRQVLGADRFGQVRSFAAQAISAQIRSELADCRIRHDLWFSEQEMVAAGKVAEALTILTAAGKTYRKDDAIWFRASRHGDDKDRVLVRSDGESTYFAADIAYHLDKYQRGYDRIINLFGADHHGYVPRLRGFVQALGKNSDTLEIQLIQFVSLIVDGERVKMSTRGGRFTTLAELLRKIGTDATRLFFVAQRADSHMDFKVDLALRKDNQNPLYYVQYAHARCCALLAKWGGDHATLTGAKAAHLSEPEAITLLADLAWLAPTVATAARTRAPHLIWHWLYEHARNLHAYYDRVPILSGKIVAYPSRLALIAAVRQSLANALGLLGVSAPASM